MKKVFINSNNQPQEFEVELLIFGAVFKSGGGGAVQVCSLLRSARAGAGMPL